MDANEALRRFNANKQELLSRRKRQREEGLARFYGAARLSPEYVCDDAEASRYLSELEDSLQQRVNTGTGHPYAEVCIARHADGYTPRGVTDGVSATERVRIKTPAFLARPLAVADEVARRFCRNNAGFSVRISHQYMHAYDGPHTLVVSVIAHFE